MHVLYVDDDRVNSLLFAELCRVADGVTVEVAGSGSEALECLAHGAVDLLVVDLHLPDADGLELLARLRARAGQRVPAFLCTADDPTTLAEPARDAGYDGCWAKPLDVAQVLAVLRSRVRSAAG